MGKMMEQGPVLIVTFQAQLVMVIRNPKGEVFEGDPVSGMEWRLGIASPSLCMPPLHRPQQGQAGSGVGEYHN